MVRLLSSVKRRPSTKLPPFCVIYGIENDTIILFRRRYYCVINTKTMSLLYNLKLPKNVSNVLGTIRLDCCCINQ